MGGNPKHSVWSGGPEDRRHQVKLNVRVSPARLEQVRRMSKKLKKTMGEVIILAIDALELSLAESKEQAESWGAIKVAKKTDKPSKPTK